MIGKLKGQTTVEYILILCLVALPLSILFVRATQRFFALILKNFTNNFPAW